FENFNGRTTVGNLGVSTYGTTWQERFYFGNFGVDFDEAYFNNGSVVGTWNYAGTPWASDFVMTARIRCGPNPITGTATMIGFRIEDSVGSEYVALEFWASTGFDRRAYYFFDGDGTGGAGGSITVPHDWLTDDWYLVKYDTTQGVKFWNELGTEPTDWTVIPALTT